MPTTPTEAARRRDLAANPSLDRAMKDIDAALVDWAAYDHELWFAISLLPDGVSPHQIIDAYTNAGRLVRVEYDQRDGNHIVFSRSGVA